MEDELNPQETPDEVNDPDETLDENTEPGTGEDLEPEDTEEEVDDLDEEGDEPEADEGEDPKWKAIARKWQKRAKDNRKELEAAREQIAAMEASNTRAEAVRNAAREAKVDEAVLARMTGETPEEIAENARILAAAMPKAGGYPPVDDSGAGSGSYGMTLDEINKIKNPTERVMARAKYPNAK